jgi:metal-responsive CopG/Arc/MetJ family transcriptional regulator
METISITLPPKLKELMDDYVKEQSVLFGTDRSEFIRNLIIAHLKKNNRI